MADDMKFRTWEDAAAWAAESITESFASKANPQSLVGILEVHYNKGDWSQVAHWAASGLLATRGRNLADREFVDGIVAHIASKQHDYGHDNILRFGIDGVKVRVWDKIARLKNLLSKGAEARNEALEDTWLDIVGYSLIAIMLENGVFELPLAADIEPTRTPVATFMLPYELYQPEIVHEVIDGSHIYRVFEGLPF